DDGDDSDEEGSDDDHKLVRFVLGARMARRAKLRRLIVAKLLSQRGEDDDEGEEFDDESSDDHRLVRFLLARKMGRGRKLRRAVLAKLLSERGGDDGDEEFETGEEEPEGFGRAGKAAVLGAAKRRQRVRRAALAKVLSEQDS